MRYILILILFIISSCASLPPPPPPPPSPPTGGFSDPENEIQRDSIVFLMDSDADGVPDFFDEEENMLKPMLSQPKTSGNIGRDEVVRPVSSGRVDNHQESLIITNDEDLSPVRQVNETGFMSHNIPLEMKVGELYPIKLRITRSSNTNVVIIDVEANDKIHTIRTSSVMEVVLSDPTPGDKVFEIEVITKEDQSLDEALHETYTEWKWNVRPTKGGKNKLSLVIYIYQITEFGNNTMGIPVFDEDIQIESNIPWTVWRFISTYWEWIAGSIAIPLFGLLWKFIIVLWKRRKEEDDQSS